jgi:hypothetical protein
MDSGRLETRHYSPKPIPVQLPPGGPKTPYFASDRVDYADTQPGTQWDPPELGEDGRTVLAWLLRLGGKAATARVVRPKSPQRLPIS